MEHFSRSAWPAWPDKPRPGQALEGFAGLQQGLALIRHLTELRWDSIHPQLDPEDDNDPTERVNILVSLCDHETLLWPLQQTPLVESKLLGRFNFRDISIASGKSTKTSSEKEVHQATIDAAVQDCEPDFLKQTFRAIAASLDNLNQLETIVTDFVGVSDAPSFAVLRAFLKESLVFLTASLEKKGVTMDDEATTDDQELAADASAQSGDGAAGAPTKTISGTINNNQDVIKTLNLVCDYYQKHEPSSPVPIFIERALRLVGKNFIDVLQDIAPAGVNEAKFILGKQQEGSS
jgi:type VI secretion system protein ImpA